MRGAFQYTRLDRRGSVAVEAAIVIFAMCLLILGLHETYMYVRTVALVERAAYSVADIMARQKNQFIDCAQTDNALNLGTYVEVARQIAQPLDLPNKGMLYLSAIDINAASGNAQVAWRRHAAFKFTDATPQVGPDKTSPPGDLPAGIEPTDSVGDTLLVVEVFYHYDPFAATRSFWPAAPGEVTIARRAYYRARIAPLNTLTKNASCSGLPG